MTSKKASRTCAGGCTAASWTTLHQHAGAVGVERPLHDLLHLAGDARLLRRQDRLDVAAADDLAHGALGHRLDGALRVEQVEHEVLRPGGVDAPLHVEVDVDDVLVAGQHHALLEHVAPAPPRAAAGAVADLDRVDGADVRLDHLADRVGQVVAQALAGLADVAAEDRVDADLARRDRVEARGEPEQHGAERQRGEALAAHGAAAGDEVLDAGPGRGEGSARGPAGRRPLPRRCGPPPQGPPEPPRLPHGPPPPPPPPPLWLLQGIVRLSLSPSAGRSFDGDVGRVVRAPRPPVKDGRWWRGRGADQRPAAAGRRGSITSLAPRVPPLQVDEGEGVLVVRAGRVILAAKLAEGGAVEGGEEHVALGRGVDEGEVEPLGLRQGERVDLCPADHHGLGGAHRGPELGGSRARLVPVARDVHARRREGSGRGSAPRSRGRAAAGRSTRRSCGP